jgi:hypothetical protein
MERITESMMRETGTGVYSGKMLRIKWQKFSQIASSEQLLA